MDLCFTVVIKGNNGYQFSYQLAYQPCPIWTEENRNKWIINMCDDGLFYKKGAFKKLLDKTGIYPALALGRGVGQGLELFLAEAEDELSRHAG